MLAVIALVAILALLTIGMPVGVILLVVGFAGLLVVLGLQPALTILSSSPLTTVAQYEYAVVPLFILTGEIILFSGAAEKLFSSCRKWVGHLTGGLAVATVLMGAGFGALSGSSTAAAAVFTKIAGTEMRRHGYHAGFSLGTVAAAGTLAAMIPPSVTIVIYGMLTLQPIGKLLIAGFLPGLLQATCMGLAIWLLAKRNPALAPASPRAGWKDRIVSLKDMWAVFAIAATLFGGIYSGVVTATQAGAVAVVVGVATAVLGRAFKSRLAWQSLLDTVRVTSSIFIIVVGGIIFSRFLAASGASASMTLALTDLPIGPIYVVMLMVPLYLLLGMFLDGLSMMVLTLPIFLPFIKASGFDPLWFGMLVVSFVELGLLTPPVGLNVFVVAKLTPDVPMETIFRGVLPLVFADLVAISVLIAFPPIATFLPSMMG